MRVGEGETPCIPCGRRVNCLKTIAVRFRGSHLLDRTSTFELAGWLLAGTDLHLPNRMIPSATMIRNRWIYIMCLYMGLKCFGIDVIRVASLLLLSKTRCGERFIQFVIVVVGS